MLNLFSFLRCLSFCPDFFGHVGKQLNKKAKVSFKTCDVMNWEKYTYCRIYQEVKVIKNQNLVS